MRQNHLILIIAILSIFQLNCRKAITGKIFSTDLVTSDPPIQEMINEDQSFFISNKYGKFKITPIADYSISSKVVSTENYSSGWEAVLAPVDLALVWGLLSREKYKKGIKYSQRNRWYYYRYRGDFPLDNEYIISHSSNNHIIPASYNLRLALKEIKIGDKVKIDGALVRVDGNINKRSVFWKSSLRRNDSGGGSCELIYAETIRINNKLFR